MNNGSFVALMSAWVATTALACGDSGSVGPSDNESSERVPTYLAVSPSRLAIEKSSSVQLQAGVYDADSALIADATITFTSADTSLIDVSGAGMVHAKGVVGSTQVDVSSGTLSVVVPVDLCTHPEGVVDTTLALKGRPWSVALSPQGIMYITRRDYSAITRYNLNTGELWYESFPIGADALWVSFAPDGSQFYTTGGTDVEILEPQHHMVLGQIEVGAQPRVVVESPDRSLLYILTYHDFRIHRRGEPYSRVSLTSPPNTGLTGIAPDPTSDRIYVSDWLNGEVRREGTSSPVTYTYFVGGRPQQLVITPDGEDLFIANETALMRTIHVPTTGIDSIPRTAGGYGVALSPDARVLYLSVPDRGVVLVVDHVARQVVRTIATGGKPRHITFDKLGTMAVVTNENGWLNFIR